VRMENILTRVSHAQNINLKKRSNTYENTYSKRNSGEDG